MNEKLQVMVEAVWEDSSLLKNPETQAAIKEVIERLDKANCELPSLMVRVAGE